MSDHPFDPSTDPLLAELGQLGVAAGGVPIASGAALLAKAAATTPIVIGFAGVKLYSLIGAALLVGFGGGALFTRALPPAGPTPATVYAVQEAATPATTSSTEERRARAEPAVASLETASPRAFELTQRPMDGASAPSPYSPTSAPLANWQRPPDGSRPVRARTGSTAPMPPIGAAATGGCPQTTPRDRLPVVLPAGDDDSWIPDPEPSADSGPQGTGETNGGRALADAEEAAAEQDAALEAAARKDAVAALAPEKDPADAESQAESMDTAVTRSHRSSRVGLQPAEGHLRAAIGGGALLYSGAPAPTLGPALGIELIAPGPPPAALLLALNLDAGIAAREQLALGTVGIDGELGIALRPSGLARFEFSGLGGVRLLQRDSSEQPAGTIERPEGIPQDVWDSLSEEAQRERGVVIDPDTPAGPDAHPVFGGRFGLVLGDRQRSPLAFRVSIFGQALVVRAQDRSAVIPVLGGTVGLDVALPAPNPAKR